MLAIVDAGPLIAAADYKDANHSRCVAELLRPDLDLVIPVLVVTEAAYFIGQRRGAQAEAAFVRGLQTLEVEAPRVGEWVRIGELVEQYADFPLGTTDASVVALAERLRTDVIITLDRRHFGAVRPRHVAGLRLLPE